MTSILMPVYNGIEFIEESVSSVLAQTTADWELIIGINGHPEGSAVYETARQYEIIDPRIRVLDLYFMRGKTNALNHMIKECRYEYVGVLDVDDKWLPEKLEAQIPYMGIYDVIGTRCEYFGDIEGICPFIPTGDLESFDFLFENPIMNSSAILKKDIVRYWSDEYYGLDDYELWLRLWKEKRRFYNCPDVLVLHRIHKASAFNTSDRQSIDVERLRSDFRNVVCL